MIVFIGCGKKKNNKKCCAKNMYQGNYFNTCLQYAKTFTNENDIYILSAKYGVLCLDTIIEPYNITLNNFTKEQNKNWTEMVINQLKELNINNNEKVIMLCGKNYYKNLLTYFNDIELPLKDFEGMGYQISFMKQQIVKFKINYLF